MLREYLISRGMNAEGYSKSTLKTKQDLYISKKTVMSYVVLSFNSWKYCDVVKYIILFCSYPKTFIPHF